MSIYSFLDQSYIKRIPRTFDYDFYRDIEEEFWCFFPETFGKRVNLVSIGLTANLYIESFVDKDQELSQNEIYVFMPYPDYVMKPMRMILLKRLDLEEFRRCNLTCVKLMGKCQELSTLLKEAGLEILGPELLSEISKVYFH